MSYAASPFRDDDVSEEASDSSGEVYRFKIYEPVSNIHVKYLLTCFIKVDNNFSPRIFPPQKVYDLDTLRSRLTSFEEQLNEISRGTAINIVFFTQAIGHIVRACRALRCDRGSILMVGVGGSGKRTSTRLATYVCGYRLFTINTSR